MLSVIIRSLKRMDVEDRLVVMRTIAGLLAGLGFFVAGEAGVGLLAPPVELDKALSLAILIYLLTILPARIYLSGKLPPDQALRKSIYRGAIPFFASWLTTWIVLYDAFLAGL